MMLGRAALVCAGKLGEDFLRKGCAEYEKRLSRYLRLTIHEVRDRPDSIPDDRALAQEGADMLRRVEKEDFVVALAIEGKQMDSPGLARFLADIFASGRRAVFILGSSRGLSEEALGRADARLSFSPMTFPHGLARLMLLEQVYRACRIASGEAYHK